MSNIVFIVNLLRDQKINIETNHISFQLIVNKWCDKNKTQLVVLDERIYPEDYITLTGINYLFQLLEESSISYDQVLIADADTIIHPQSPSPFDVTDHKFSVVLSYGSFDWVCRSIENYKKHLFPNVDLLLWKYFNSGIIICNEKHKEFYDKIVKYYLKIEIILLNYKRHMGWELINQF